MTTTNAIATEEQILEILRLPWDQRGTALTSACQRILATITNPRKWGWDGTYGDLSAQDVIDNAWVLGEVSRRRKAGLAHVTTDVGDCVSWCSACRAQRGAAS